jgi:hypothetical protein
VIEPAERRALSELSRLDWAPTQEDVWSPLDIHIDELNGDVGQALLRAFEEAENSKVRCPLGLVIEGRQGAGKTHLVRWAREQVQLRHGYFFLMGITDGRSFWTNIVHAFLRGLRRSGSYRHLQLSVFLGALAEIAQVTNAMRLMARGDQPITPEALDQLVSGVRRHTPRWDATAATPSALWCWSLHLTRTFPTRRRAGCCLRTTGRRRPWKRGVFPGA